MISIDSSHLQNNVPLLDTEQPGTHRIIYEQISPNLPADKREALADVVCKHVADGTMVANPKSCRHYFECNGKYAIERLCAEGYAFNEDGQRCDPQDEIDCIKCPETGFQILADPKNCHHFYKCSGGERIKMTCPAGQRFDRELAACKPRAEVRCNVENVCRHENTTDTKFLVGDLNSCVK